MKEHSNTSFFFGVILILVLFLIGGAPAAASACVQNWSVVPSPNVGTGNNSLNALAAVSDADIWAVGSYSKDPDDTVQTLIEHWDGREWTMVPSPNVGQGDSQLNAISAISANDIWAVGSVNDTDRIYKPLLIHWDGTLWTVSTHPQIENSFLRLSGVDASATDDVWAVGIYYEKEGPSKPLILHWDGLAWKQSSHTNLNGSSPSGVAVISNSETWIVGSASILTYDLPLDIKVPLTAHSNLDGWVTFPTPGSGLKQNSLDAIAANTSEDIWAVGSSRPFSRTETLIEHWNGSTWSIVPSQNPSESSNVLTAVAVHDRNDVWVAGTYFSGNSTQGLVQHWNGKDWETTPIQNPAQYRNTIKAISTTPTGTVWIAGSQSRERGTATRTLIERHDSPTCDLGASITPPSTTPSKTLTPLEQADTLLDNAEKFYQDGVLGQAFQEAKNALELYGKLGERAGEADALHLLGKVAESRNEYSKALESFQAERPIRQEIGDRKGEANALHYIGRVYDDLKDYPKALDSYYEAEDLRKQIGDLAGEWKTLYNIALVFIDQKAFEAALEYYNKAVAVTSEIGDQRAEIEILISIGRMYTNKGDVYLGGSDQDMAESYFDKAIEKAQSTNDYEFEARALIGKGNMWMRNKIVGAAIDQFQQALRVALGAYERQAAAEAAKALGNAYSDACIYGPYERCNNESALAALRIALVLYSQTGDRDGEAGVFYSLGWTYNDRGDDEQAQIYFKKALPHFESSGDPEIYFSNLEGVVISCKGSADRYRKAGEYRIALNRYDCALKAGEDINSMWEKKTIPFLRYIRLMTEYANLADVAASEGAIYARLGQIEKAISSVDKAVMFAENAAKVAGEWNPQMKAAFSSVWVYHLLNAADVYMATRNTVRAQELLDRAKEVDSTISQEKNPYGTRFADAWLNAVSSFGGNDLATSYRIVAGHIAIATGKEQLSSGEYAKAKETFARAREEFQKYYNDSEIGLSVLNGSLLGMTQSFNGTGLAQYNLGEYSEAAAAFGKAKDLADKTDDIEQQYTALFGLGLVLEIEGRQDEALANYRSAVALAEDIRNNIKVEEYQISFAGTTESLYQHIIALLVQRYDYTQAFDFSERARARAFLDQVSNSHFNFRKGTDEELSKKETALRLEISSLERQLGLERAKPLSEQNVNKISSLLSELTNKEKEYQDLIIEIKLASPEVASLVSVTPLSLAEVQKLLDADTTVLSYFSLPSKLLIFIITKDSFEVAEVPVVEKDLTRAVTEFREFTNLSQTPPSLRQLYNWLISPVLSDLKTKKLGIVPTGILHYLPFAALTDGQSFLSEKYVLFSLPSSSSLGYIARKKQSDGTVLIMAQSQATGLPQLRYVNKEARAIAKIYSTRALLGKSATISALQNRAGDAKILHIAAHAKLNRAQPLFSNITLAPDTNHDGILNVQDVYELSLDKAELVVLSACETQLGGKGNGDDFIGLSRAFMYAGTPSIFASLWNVDDESTTEMMTSLYIHLKEGVSKAEALRAAQADVRRKYPNPYYWAGFVLTGDPGQ